MYGLIKLHSRIEGAMIGPRGLTQDRKNAERLVHIRAVIRIVEPRFDVRRIKPKRRHTRNPWFKAGEGFLSALDVLREAPEPITNWEIAKRMLVKSGVAQPEEWQIRIVTNMIKNTLIRYEGKLLTIHGDKKPRRWSIIFYSPR
jgi:hypothetical protein